MDTYIPPLSLTILGAISLLIGAICACIIALDIVVRKGWRTMMWIMIPTYIITATYFGPAPIWLYWRYGRPKSTSTMQEQEGSADESILEDPAIDSTALNAEAESHMNQHEHHMHHDGNHGVGDGQQMKEMNHHEHGNNMEEHQMMDHNMHHGEHNHVDEDQMPEHHMHEKVENEQSKDEEAHQMAHHQMNHHASKDAPFYISVLVGVTHCGAGCVLGDIVGEWIVYGTNVTINGRSLWPEFLIDYAFALLFGILFQYFSIAPMSGDWGVKSLIRAAKADVASLTAFEIGLFGWMAIYQIAIFNWKLGTVTTVYWWMMQVGMILGFATSFPMNWILIKYGIKEPHVM